MATTITCMHLGCHCLTEEQFCSPYCREHGEGQHEHDPSEPGCGCGHEACLAGVPTA